MSQNGKISFSRRSFCANTGVPPPRASAAHPYEYSDIAIQTLLTLKAMFRLPYSALEGFGHSLMQLFMHQMEWKFFPMIHVQCYPYMSFIQCNESA